MKKTFTLIATFLSLATIAQTSVFDVIATSPNHTILEQALIQEGLDVVLSDLSSDYTVFAPNDAAFTQFLSDNSLTAGDLLANPDLTNILLQHVVAGTVLSTDLTNGEVVTIYGLDVTVDLSMGVMIDDAEVINPFDATAPNGVVHTIDYVLLPTYDDVTEVVSFSPNHTILLQALQTANLVTTLQDLSEEFTVFAPNDAAFTQFLSDNSLTAGELLSAPNLSNILLHHIVGGTVLSTDLSNGPVTTLNTTDIFVDLTSGVMINDAEVIGADIEADNGVVHVLDYVLSLDYGLSILENNTNISAYPNPTSDKLFVDGIISGESFNIVSLDGKIVTSGNVLNNTLSVEDLTNGVYFVNFNESNVSIRVIKK